MAAVKPLTTEAIALTEKKMDMTLEDIIKMSKKPTSKGNNATNGRRQRVLNKSQKPLNGTGGAAKGNNNNSKARRFMDSRSSIRQGAFAQRRSSFQGKQFPLTTEVARKAAVTPIRNNRPFNRNRMVSWNKPRFGAPPVQRKTDVGLFVKRQQMKVVPNRRPQTLDSLFANMKEQRIRVQSQQNARLQQNNGRFQFQSQRMGAGNSVNGEEVDLATMQTDLAVGGGRTGCLDTSLPTGLADEVWLRISLAAI